MPKKNDLAALQNLIIEAFDECVFQETRQFEGCLCFAFRLLQFLPHTQNPTLHPCHGSTDYRPYMDTAGVTVGLIPTRPREFSGFWLRLTHSIQLPVRQIFSGLFRTELALPEYSSGRALGESSLGIIRLKR